MRVSEKDADLIRASFRGVNADSRRVAEAFYRHLFEIDPGSRRMFIADINRQGMKLTSTLAVVVAHIEDWAMLAPQIEDLAMRHLVYGVTAEQYPAVGEALQRMLAELLGTGYTPDVAAAWARAYDGLQDYMIAIAYPVQVLSDD